MLRNPHFLAFLHFTHLLLPISHTKGINPSHSSFIQESKGNHTLISIVVSFVADTSFTIDYKSRIAVLSWIILISIDTKVTTVTIAAIKLHLKH